MTKVEKIAVSEAIGFTIQQLFAAARANPRNPMNRPGRLMGRHCKARLKRAQAKRDKHPRGMKAYTP